MDELLKQIALFGEMTSTITLLDVTLVFIMSFGMCMVLAWVYRYTHKGVSYSQSFVHNLVLLGITVAFIMLIIGSNIARAFTLVGALSIIRFRSAVKETKDLGFVFMTMAIGMASGTKFYLMAVFATLALSTAVIIMSKLNLFAKVISERILIARVAKEAYHEELFAEVFDRSLDSANLISVETVRQDELLEVIYSVVLKKKASPAHFLEEIRRANGDKKVSLVLGQQEIDL